MEPWSTTHPDQRCLDTPLNIAIAPALKIIITISVTSDIFDLNADAHKLHSCACNLTYTYFYILQEFQKIKLSRGQEVSETSTVQYNVVPILQCVDFDDVRADTNTMIRRGEIRWRKE